MSLEARIELLTAAVIELTAAIGGMQALAKTQGTVLDFTQTCSAKSTGGISFNAANEEVPNARSESATSGSLTASAPTGGSSLPDLDYVKDVKPITLRLSKEKGREVTIAVLQRFGVKGAQDLDKSRWVEYIVHCEKVLAGGDV